MPEFPNQQKTHTLKESKTKATKTFKNFWIGDRQSYN